MIAANLNTYKLIVEKSTVPVGTGQWIKKTIARQLGLDQGKRDEAEQVEDWRPRESLFDVACNPEFLQEGRAVDNILCPDRVICGVESERARLILSEIYRPLNCPVLFSNISTAEVIKYAANAFLSAKISFINMVADFCRAVGADVNQVAQGLGYDPRISPHFLRAGIGFGGHCLPKDLRAFIHLGEKNGLDFSFLVEVERINSRRIESYLRDIRNALPALQGKTIAVLGLSFKPDTDDIREAPSLKLIPRLLEEGASLQLYDLQAMPVMRATFQENPGRLVYASSAYEAAEQADALLILTDWTDFATLDLKRLRQAMRVPVILEGRNMFEPSDMAEAGFEYYSVGRPQVDKKT